ncbi:MAG: hypothetical protein M3365_02785 [Gemmatimonadota bacterium]|nr:hypothetical protein [Gemmatimonadota bacterium]
MRGHELEGNPHPHGSSGYGGGRDHPDEAAALGARIAIVASIILGQLWALTVALDSWLGGEATPVYWLLLFQAASFGVSLLIWLASPRR